MPSRNFPLDLSGATSLPRPFYDQSIPPHSLRPVRWRRCALRRLPPETTPDALQFCTLGLPARPWPDQSLRFHRRSEEHTSELQSQSNIVCRLLLEKKKIGVHAEAVSPPGTPVLSISSANCLARPSTRATCHIDTLTALVLHSAC